MKREKNNGKRWLLRKLSQELLGPEGKKGGRPRRVQHDPEAKRCRCAECRRERREAPYKEEGKR